MKETPNKLLQPTATFAAQGVLRPPCSLRMAAAEQHVRPIKEQRERR